MKRIIIILLISLASAAYALPNCPSDQSVRWHNCFGTHTWDSGDKYVGEFNDDEFHGQGTYTNADGTKESGYWMKGEFVPEICEEMGLSKGTSVFGRCVLKLIDKL